MEYLNELKGCVSVTLLATIATVNSYSNYIETIIHYSDVLRNGAL